eukprot:gb/GFBE01039690.1/.p1 GENE.gb/GFBE01039690.1/~~gb/GFBE01039690.1/.p1  ORF type:complete len:247 (+),score=60.83 gb/GFBE01039690.1/:1-741(+)
MSGTREENLYMAKVAKECERWEDTMEYMKRVVARAAGEAMSAEERNLFSSACKETVTSRRQALRAIKARVKASRALPAEAQSDIQAYHDRVEQELNTICKETIAVISEQLLPTASSDAESQVFYLKMVGDYYRYLAENSDDETYRSNAQQSYSDATSVANANLPVWHPVTLGLALNFSVFCYEVLKDEQGAIKLALDANSRAMEAVDQADEASLQDGQAILERLHQNLQLWKSGAGDFDGTAVEEM